MDKTNDKDIIMGITLPPEKIGSFYLGAKHDVESDTIINETINYNARDLTTHAVCVGMTGSGKTGLCVGLLEEAALDKIPAIIIDPKGDMTNLLLQFENLDSTEFEKWVNIDDANRKGLSIQEYAAQTAKKWKEGLAFWGEGESRIRDLKESVDYTIFTPGSNAGIPVNILGSFAAPKINFDDDTENLREQIQGIVAAILGMIQYDVDPVRSKEGILLAQLFEYYWRRREDLDLITIIKAIQKPPIKQLGVFDVDTFFPEKERFKMAMAFNNLIASPQFSYWLQGENLDIDKIYFTASGKPRHSIFYIAHLSESERMFFVTLLLNSLVSWMRRQSGTNSLRSLLYFDEIFGYFPPTANPPSKKPMLTILKQARAYGLGAVLVTQNPVDIDYKGLSNAGTWFIGKLQTDRDKERVLSGLKGAISNAGSSNKINFNKIISALKARVFLLHNVHENEPVLFNTRWVMSYLRGPLTRPQVKSLMQAKKESKAIPLEITNMNAVSIENEIPIKYQVETPQLDPNIHQRYLPVLLSKEQATKKLGYKNLTLEYRAFPLLSARVRFFDNKRKIDKVSTISYISPIPDEFDRIDWSRATKANNWENNLSHSPSSSADKLLHFPVSDNLNSIKELEKIKKEYGNWLYQTQNILIHELVKYKIHQGEDESVEGFHMRVQQKARELRDEELDKLSEKYETKLDRIQEKLRKENQDLEEAEADARDRKNAEWIGMAETVFSIFVKKRSRSFGSTASKRRMSRKANQRVESSYDDIKQLEENFLEIKNELDEKLSEIREKWSTIPKSITTKQVSPRRTDIIVDSIILLWQPFWVTPNGENIAANLP